MFVRSIRSVSELNWHGYQGKTDFYLNGRHCKAGCILIKQADAIDHIQADTMHKKIFKWFFNQDLLGEFAYQNGQWKHNSFTFNTKPDFYHDHQKGMPLTEQQLLGSALARLYINHVKEISSSNYGWNLFD